jgi:hypothetical protein
MMMKNAVKCDNNCDMQPLVNHHIFDSFSDGMPLGISGTFNFMLVFQAEHNILIYAMVAFFD